MLNKVSVTDCYVLPTPEDIFDNIKDAGVYTTLDLRWGFYRVCVAEEDIPKTPFWGPGGLYEWVVMPGTWIEEHPGVFSEGHGQDSEGMYGALPGVILMI
jgi:hypothetical protein